MQTHVELVLLCRLDGSVLGEVLHDGHGFLELGLRHCIREWVSVDG